MLRGSLALMLLWSLGALAPMQCASPRPYEQRREETPAEALWTLAERFDAQHNRDARDETLRFLLQHAPGSRYAARARVALESGAMPAEEPRDDAAVSGAAP